MYHVLAGTYKGYAGQILDICIFVTYDKTEAEEMAHTYNGKVVWIDD